MDRKLSQVEKADLKAARAAAPWTEHPLIRLLAEASKLADQPPLYALSWATLGIGLASGRGRLARAGARMLAAEWIATAAKSAIKHRVDRTRPHVPQQGGRYRMERGESDDKPVNSFPSGHSAGAFAVARAFASEYPEHKVAAFSAATVAAAMQVPRSTHYPTDVVAGAAIGLAAGSMASVRATGHRGR